MPVKFTIDIEPEAIDDIQNAIDFYNSRRKGLGKRFFDTIDRHFTYLTRNYYSFAIRYDDIRCMKVEKFPYMIHYKILPQQKTVSVKAVFCTFENPDKWDERIK